MAKPSSLNVQLMLISCYRIHFKDEVEKFIAKNKNRFNDKTIPNRLGGLENTGAGDNTSVSLIECFIRDKEGGIDQIFILDEDTIIYEKISIGVSQDFQSFVTHHNDLMLILMVIPN